MLYIMRMLYTMRCYTTCYTLLGAEELAHELGAERGASIYI